jgi:parvulin-like peptidyl-prolyl isomerase
MRASQIVVKDKTKARKLLAAVKTLDRDDEAGFAALVDTDSEDLATKGQKGDLGFVTREQPGIPRAVIDAIFALHDAGDVTGLVQTERGWHILRLTERRTSIASTYADSRNDIRERLYQAQRARWMDRLLTAIRKQVGVETYEAELSKVAIDLRDAGESPQEEDGNQYPFGLTRR